MKKTRTLVILLAAAAALPALAGAGDLGPLEPIADLHRAVREDLGLPDPLAVRLLEAGLPPDHLPVIGHIAREARVSPDRVAEMRLGGMGYVDISLRLGKGPEIFYVPFAADPGPPYGNAWGYFRNRPRREWRGIRLPDADVVNLVNLRLATRHYGVPADRVVALRAKGRGFDEIHRELAAATGKHGTQGRGTQAAGQAGKGNAKEKQKPPGAGKGKPKGGGGKPPR